MIHSPRFPIESEPASDPESESTSEPAVSNATSDNDEHDFPSTTMIHSPRFSIESEPASEPESESTSEPAVSNAAPDNQVEKEEDDEAQIHHVARVTFEGDRSKGQLSFTTGSKVEAHSNQRGPWWLGRCCGRTGWFPASAVVPASEFLRSPVNRPSSNIADEDENDVAQLSGDELNAVYDLIRNPSESEDESSPAKSRWLGSADKSNAAQPSRDYSPPPSRFDPSEMAGLSERLYDSHDDDSHSNKNEIVGRSPPPTSYGEIASESKSVEVLHHPEETDETLSKDKPPKAQSQSAEISKVGENVSKGNAAKYSPSEANAAKTKPKLGWRATKDPNSGLIYYYHAGTRETTWKKPPGFVPAQAPAKGTPRSARRPATKNQDKPKVVGARGIMGFLSKMKKTKPEAETNLRAQKSPDVPIRNVRVPIEAIDSDKEGEVADKIDYPQAAKPKAQTIRQAEKEPVHEPAVKLAAEAESPQKDFWSTLDDDESSAASDESEHSEMSEGTQTSLFSKHMLKTKVGRWAEKITEKLNSPPSTPYETLGEGTERPQDTPESSAQHVQLKEKSFTSAASNDERPTKEEVAKTQIQSEDAQVIDEDENEPLTTEEKRTAQIGSDGDASETDHAVPNEAITEDEKKAREEESKTEEILSLDDATKDVNRKKTQWPQWRSAIDAATGRTYYYVKGSQKVTWEKPSDL
mmetsp:Transcript_43857/g.78712  ORF Transcript_43857/g.78712 Transcript_43857/m.78712 type:complete len:696 (+) Transcript_43857:3-2090(+)